MKRNVKRALRASATLAIVALLVIFARRINWHTTWTSISDAAPRPLLLAAVLNIISLLVKGTRWWIFLRPQGCSLGLALRATVAGAGLNNVLVANAGEAARVMFVSRVTGGSSAGVLAALTLERLFDAIGYTLLLALATLFLDLPHSVARFRYGAVVLLLLVLALLGYLLRRPRSEPLGQRILPPGTAFLMRARGYGAHFIENLQGLITVPRAAVATLLSIIAWSLQVATYHLTAVALHFPISLAGSIAVLLTENIGFLLRATPGNVGVFQFVYAITASAMGLDSDAAVAVAVLLQTLQVIPVTLLGVALAPEFVFRKKRKPPQSLA